MAGGGGGLRRMSNLGFGFKEGNAKGHGRENCGYAYAREVGSGLSDQTAGVSSMFVRSVDQIKLNPLLHNEAAAARALIPNGAPPLLHRESSRPARPSSYAGAGAHVLVHSRGSDEIGRAHV